MSSNNFLDVGFRIIFLERDVGGGEIGFSFELIPPTKLPKQGCGDAAG